MERLFNKQTFGVAVTYATAAICSRYGPFVEWHKYPNRPLVEHFIAGFSAPWILMLIIGIFLFYKLNRPLPCLDRLRAVIQNCNEYQKDIRLLIFSAAGYIALSFSWETYQYVVERNYGFFQLDQFICDVVGATLWGLTLSVYVLPRHHVGGDLEQERVS